MHDALQAAGQVHAQTLAPVLDQLMCKPDAMLRLLTRLLTSIKSAPLTDAAGLNGRLHALDLIMQSHGMLRCLVSPAWGAQLCLKQRASSWSCMSLACASCCLLLSTSA